MKSITEGTAANVDFSKTGKIALRCPDVVPVAVQDIATGEVILLAYTNEQAFRKAISSRRLVLWSTSRNELWEKGKTSGSTFELVEAYLNCEQNALLYKVRRAAGTIDDETPAPIEAGICHTRNKQGIFRNCFYRRINLDTMDLENLDP